MVAGKPVMAGMSACSSTVYCLNFFSGYGYITRASDSFMGLHFGVPLLRYECFTARTLGGLYPSPFHLGISTLPPNRKLRIFNEITSIFSAM